MDERSERWARRFEWPVLIAALLVIPVIVVEESEPGSPWEEIAAVGNWAIWAVFLIELVVMLAVVPKRWQWLRENPLDVAIVVLTPPFLPSSLQALRVFRLLRLLRLLRLVEVARRLFSLQGLRYAALLAVLTALGGGAAFAAVEEGQNENVSGTWDGVWWAIVTMTTVGYGDVSPQTDSGRVIAIGVMVVGIGFLGLLIGATAERFIAKEIAEAGAEITEEVEETEAELRAELRTIARGCRVGDERIRRGCVGHSGMDVDARLHERPHRARFVLDSAVTRALQRFHRVSTSA